MRTNRLMEQVQSYGILCGIVGTSVPREAELPRSCSCRAACFIVSGISIDLSNKSVRLQVRCVIRCYGIVRQHN